MSSRALTWTWSTPTFRRTAARCDIVVGTPDAAPGPVLTLAGLARTPFSAFVPPEALLRLWCDAVLVVVQRHFVPGLGDRQYHLLHALTLVRFFPKRKEWRDVRLTQRANRLRLGQTTGKCRRRRRATRMRRARAAPACATLALSATASRAPVRPRLRAREPCFTAPYPPFAPV